jgi:hypothetical protein
LECNFLKSWEIAICLPVANKTSQKRDTCVAFFLIKDFSPHIFYNVIMIMMFQNLNEPVSTEGAA